MPLYTLEKSPPSTELSAMYSALAIGEAKLPFMTVAMLGRDRQVVGCGQM